MLTMRPMVSGDRDAVMGMVTDFYHSPAVEHEVDFSTLEQAFRDAADPAQPLIEGLLLLEDGVLTLKSLTGDVVSQLVLTESM